MSAEAGWISVVGWTKQQHKDVLRGEGPPPWVKVHTRLLHDESFLSLPVGTRSVLFHIWLEYASTRARLRADTGSLSRRFNMRVTSAQLEALEQAGFIRVVASSVQAARWHDASASYAREEVEVEVERASQVETVVRPLVHDSDSDLEESDEEHKDEEPFAIGPEPALPQNGATADEHGPQPLEPDELLERWRTA